MKIKSDWHIHSRNSCDCREIGMSIREIIAMADKQGIVDFGVSDHLHTPFNLPDIRKSRQEYLASAPPPRFHFGIEVSCVTQWEIDKIATGQHDNPIYGLRSGGPAGGELAIALTEDDISELGIEYVVGGTHWPMYVPFERQALIRDYHRQNMFLATHPLMDIVAHPWWFLTSFWEREGLPKGEPWFDDFGGIPQSMHNEFAAAAKEHDTVIEINIGAILLKDESLYSGQFKQQYLEYLAQLHESSVKLSIGSDCHHQRYPTMNFARAERMLDSVGIKDDDLWIFPPKDA